MEDIKTLGPSNTDDEHSTDATRASRYGYVDASYKMATTSSAVYATLAGVVTVGPLLGLMNSALFISATTLLLTSPLLLLSSPVLIPAGLVLAVALVGFAVSAVMALAALSMFAASYKSYINRPTTSILSGGGSGGSGVGDGGSGLVEEVADTWTESGQRVKQKVSELEGNLQQKALQLPGSPPRQQHPSSKVDQIVRANKQAIAA